MWTHPVYVYFYVQGGDYYPDLYMTYFCCMFDHALLPSSRRGKGTRKIRRFAVCDKRLSTIIMVIIIFIMAENIILVEIT